MKKITALALVLSLALGLTGCQTNSPQGPADTPGAGSSAGSSAPGTPAAPGKETQYLKFACSTMGAQWFTIAASVGEIVNKEHSDLVLTATVGAADTNLLNLENGSIDVAWCTNDGVAAALEGAREPFTQPLKNVRLIACAYESPIEIAAPASSGIDTIYDVVGKNFNTFIVGGTLQVTVEKLLKAHGISYDDITAGGGTVSYVGYDEQTMLLQDRLLDVATYMTAVPASQIVEVETSMPMHVLKLDPDIMKQFHEDNPEYQTFVVPAGTYKGQTEDVETVSVVHMILCRADLDDDTVYEITKTMWENIEDITAVHATIAKEMVLENACRSLVAELHPGALRYYQEVSVMP